MEYEGELLFLGTAYRERHELIDLLNRRFSSRFRQVPCRLKMEREVRGRDLTRLVRSYRINVCPPHPTWRRYWSNRIYTTAAHGGLVASPNVEGMNDDGWQAGVNYLELPTSPEAIADKLADYLSHDPAWLDAVRLRGYEHARTKGYDVRCAELLAALDARRRSGRASCIRSKAL